MASRPASQAPLTGLLCLSLLEGRSLHQAVVTVSTGFQAETRVGPVVNWRADLVRPHLSYQKPFYTPGGESDDRRPAKTNVPSAVGER
jgi:hypothetical protein